jgi:hypothetical protein
LEGSLNEFVAALHAASASIKQARADAERWRLEQEERERRESERLRQRWEDEQNARVFREKIEQQRFAVGSVRAKRPDGRRLSLTSPATSF